MSRLPTYGGKPHEQPSEWLEWLDACEKQSSGRLNQAEVRAKADWYRAKILAERAARRVERWEAAKKGKVAI